MGIKQYCCYILYFTLALVTLLQPVRSAEDLPEILANKTRRGLQSCPPNNNICEANNIIDKCWRCKPDWAENRKALADCAQGFAKGTIGGKWGDIYTVTSDLDEDTGNPKEGTLRFGAAQNRPLWIIFARDMVIRLKNVMAVNSDKTIDGRGAKVEIIEAGFALYNVKNIIIHNIIMHDIKVTSGGLIKSNDGPPVPIHGSDGDAISIAGSSQIWIDHCSLSKAFDGLVDAKLGTTRFTVSNSLFTQHQFVLLFGAGDTNTEDRGMLATVAFNTFTDHVDQRMPRCRHGFFQVVNNNYDRWGSYCIGGSAAPTILSQGNRFFAPDDPIKKNAVGRHGEAAQESMKWNWRSYNDLLENGAIFVASGVDPVLTPEQSEGMILAEPGEAVLRLTSSAGVLSCQPGAPC